MRLFISILIFIVALGVLVTIHEFGHFIAAKSFNIYCEEFSIGFGPRIFRVGNQKDKEKKKNALIYIPSNNETSFSLALFPLGGFVAMLGESTEDMAKGRPELKGRSVNEKSFWKRLIVSFGGILMNFILAWIMFVLAFGCFVQTDNYGYNVFGVHDSNLFKTSLTYDEAGNEPVTLDFTEYKVEKKTITEFYMLDVYTVTIDGSEYSTFNDFSYPVTIEGNDNKFALVFNNQNVSLKDIDYSNCMSIVAAQEAKGTFEDGHTGMVYVPKIENNDYVYRTLDSKDVIKPIRVLLACVKGDEYTSQPAYLHLSVSENGTLNRVGFGIYVREYRNTFSETIEAANETWWSSTKLISQTLVKLFYDKNTWSGVGGPISIFTQTSSILNNYPFAYYLQTWGMISVNLALFNFLPFPGLDGWAILVCLIEGVVNFIKHPKKKKKVQENIDLKDYVIGKDETKAEEQEWKIPAKLKGIISTVGLILIFALMAFIVIKDIVGLF